MANSIDLNVQVDVELNEQQLNSVVSQINRAMSRTNNFKLKDFFDPMTKSAKSFIKGLDGVQNSVNNLSGSFSNLKSIVLSTLSLAAITKLGKEMIKLSSDLIEVQNVVDTVFGEMSSSIDEFSKTALKTFGLTELQAKNYASTIGAIVKATGVGADATLEMSEGIAKLTADVASFYNLDHDTAFNKLRSGITGETEPLKSLGVVMTEVNLEAYRLSKGIATSYKEMNQAEKTALRYNFILDTLSDTQGDFNKTQGSWSNQVRILTGQIQQLGAILGGFLQQVLSPILTVVNQIVGMAISGAQALAKMFGFDMESIEASQFGVVSFGDAGASSMEDLADSTDDATAAQKKLNKEQKKGLSNLHDLNVLQDSSSGSASTAGVSVPGIDTGGISFDLADYIKVGEDDAKIENKVTEVIDKVKEKIEGGDWEGAGEVISEEITKGLETVKPAEFIPQATEAAQHLAEFLNGLTDPAMFAEAGRILGESLNLLMATVNTFFSTYDWHNLGVSLAAGLNKAIDTVDPVELGHFLMNKVKAIFGTLAGFFSEFDAQELADKLLITINTMINDIPDEGIAATIAGLINAAITIVGTLLGGVEWDTLGEKIFSIISGVLSQVHWDELFTGIVNAFNNLPAPIQAALTAFLAFKGLSAVVPIITSVVSAFTSLKTLLGGGMIAGESLSFIQNLGNALALTANGAGTLHEALVATFGGVATTLAGVGAVIVGAITAVSNFITMLKEGFSWVNELLMIVGIAAAAIGAVILGAPAAIAAAVAGIVAALATLIVVVKDNWDAIVEFFSNLVSGIGSWLSEAWTAVSTFVSDAVSAFVDFASKAWDAVSKFFTDIVSNVGNWMSSVWNSLSEAFSDMLKTVSDFVTNAWNSLTKFFGDLITKAKDTFSELLNNISTWFTSLPGKVGEWLVSVGSTVVNWFSEQWTKIKEFFSNIITYITGTFKSSWDNAWNGLKDGVKGFVNGIIDFIQGFINVFVTALNWLIEKLNTISFTVPDWVPVYGGRVVGINLPYASQISIPHLAQGAVIPPNNEFMAVLGDQRRGINIETPLETMVGAFKQALTDMAPMLGGVQQITIPVYVNNELTTTQIVRKTDMARYRNGGL